MSYALDNEIFIGSVDFPDYRFDNSTIVLNSLSAILAVDVVGNELSVDTIAFTVRHEQGAEADYAPVDEGGYESPGGTLYAVANDTDEGRAFMTELPFGTPVFWFIGGDLFKKCYLKTVQRVSRSAWRIEAISGVGLLDSSIHEGGVYNAASFEDVAAEIIGDAFSFSVSDRVASAPVFGWLPYDSRRANLHRLLFAMGASMLPGTDGDDYEIGLIEALETPAEIPDSRIALGGSVTAHLPATGVEVTEHSFLATAGDETETLFDASESSVTDQLVVFSEPHHDLAVTGTLTISESGVNYAVISGVGVLSGKRYTHNKAVVAVSSDANTAPLIKRVEDNGLISAANSFGVASRVLAYFQSSRTVSGKIVLDGEHCGGFYSFSDFFGDPTDAFLAQLQIGVTSIRSAAATFVADYSPAGQGNSYAHAVVLTGTGSFEIPAENVKIILVQGGSGGQPGTDGQPGAGIRSDGTGAGGAGGLAGEGGKIFSIDLTGLTVGSTVAYSCGAGGLPGADGSETTFGSYSSADGQRLLNGVLNIFSGVRYGIAGTNGVDGGAAVTPAINYKGVVYVKGDDAPTIVTDVPGNRLAGGTGGGPAAGADGAEGWVGGYTTTPPNYQGGKGGDGANAVAGDDATVYGCGGNGGNGGGGGGNGGWPNWSSPYTHRGDAGRAGLGSPGGSGAAGCIIVYY